MNIAVRVNLAGTDVIRQWRLYMRISFLCCWRRVQNCTGQPLYIMLRRIYASMRRQSPYQKHAMQPACGVQASQAGHWVESSCTLCTVAYLGFGKDSGSMASAKRGIWAQAPSGSRARGQGDEKAKARFGSWTLNAATLPTFPIKWKHSKKDKYLCCLGKWKGVRGRTPVESRSVG